MTLNKSGKDGQENKLRSDQNLIQSHKYINKDSSTILRIGSKEYLFSIYNPRLCSPLIDFGSPVLSSDQNTIIIIFIIMLQRLIIKLLCTVY